MRFCRRSYEDVVARSHVSTNGTVYRFHSLNLVVNGRIISEEWKQSTIQLKEKRVHPVRRPSALIFHVSAREKRKEKRGGKEKEEAKKKIRKEKGTVIE
jgi:hypothetical protein